MIPRIILIMLSLLLIGISNANADGVKCTESLATKAEDASDQAKTWDVYYSNYKNYAVCDDGAIGEGFSDAAAQLFANHWDTIGRFIALSNKDDNFKHFALSHIDETDTYDDLQKIARNAKTACPKGRAVLCKAIWAQATYPDVMGWLEAYAIKHPTEYGPVGYYPEYNTVVTGDLTGHNTKDIAVAFTLEGVPGGNSWIRYLAVFLESTTHNDYSHHFCCMAPIGGSAIASEHSIVIKNKSILITGKAFNPETDPICCPSKPMHVTFKIKNGNLVKIP